MDSGDSVHMMRKVDVTPEEQQTMTVSQKPHRLREGTAHVRYRLMFSGFSSRT